MQDFDLNKLLDDLEIADMTSVADIHPWLNQKYLSARNHSDDCRRKGNRTKDRQQKFALKHEERMAGDYSANIKRLMNCLVIPDTVPNDLSPDHLKRIRDIISKIGTGLAP